MGDGDDASIEVHQQLFEPGDGVQVQVVGRLVQQQHVRFGHQCLRQSHPFFGPARKRAHDGIFVQVQAVQSFLDPLLPVPAIQSLYF